MTQTYFLGANSKDGFFSLYGDFPPQAGDFLHIIKGGPGTGKSGFMRRIAEAAQARGLDVHLVLCSGDPDSLDGVYLPELHSAWVDGTAPHVREPRCFGVDSDYVNLGSFCRLPISATDGEHIGMVTRKYKGLYAEAYACLNAAASLEETQRIPKSPNPWLAGQLDRLLDPCTGEASGARQRRRFLRALSCQGDLRLEEEIKKLCKQIIRVDAAALAYAAARCRGESILCLSPLDPSRPEALLLPERSLALVDEDWSLPGAKCLAEAAPITAQQMETRKLRERALALAFEKLRRAKALHDELEAVYRPYMDFEALTAFTDQHITQLFS